MFDFNLFGTPYRPRSRVRGGVSLIELVVSITCGATVLCMAIGTVAQTMKLSKEGHARAEHQRAVADLCQQFRIDAHTQSALAVITEDSPATADQSDKEMPRVRYRIAGPTVTREVVESGSSHTSREVYRLDKSCHAHMETTDAGQAVLLVQRTTAEGDMLENRVVAHVGRLLPYQSIKKGP